MKPLLIVVAIGVVGGICVAVLNHQLDKDTISIRTCPTVEDEREWVLRAEISERTLILLAVRDDRVIGMVKTEVEELCRRFPLYGAQLSNQ